MILAPTIPMRLCVRHHSPNTSVNPADAEPDGASGPTSRFRDRVRDREGAQELLVVRIGTERFAVPLEAVDELVESPQLRTRARRAGEPARPVHAG